MIKIYHYIKNCLVVDFYNGNQKYRNKQNISNNLLNYAYPYGLSYN